MQHLTNDLIKQLVGRRQAPCISLYQPTHRRATDNAQDVIRFRNLLSNAEKTLRKSYSNRKIAALLEKLRGYERDSTFWTHQLDGLAMFAAQDCFHVVKLPRPVDETVVVADSFHVKPLLRISQSADRYQVLCLSRDQVSLFEGDQHALDRVELDDVPTSLTDALGDERTDSHLTVASYGGAQGPGMHHGHGSKKDEDDVDLERFFRLIDRAIHKQHSAPSELPLVLAALPRHQAIFRRITQNPLLLETGIDLHPESLDAHRLVEKSWEIFEPQYHARLEAAVERFRLANSRSVGSDDLANIAQAAMQGRVHTLLIEAERHITGHIDPETCTLTFAAADDSMMDDVLDDIAERTLATGGTVLVVSKDHMPTTTGAAATYRF